MRKMTKNEESIRRLLESENNYTKRIDRALEYLKKPWLTASEVSAVMLTHPNTIRVWARSGAIGADRFGTRKDMRYSREHMISYLKSQRLV